ncbi:hypothetical protein WJU23_20865 [Prosthecobacter sp. SYSU 5D2]|uniref:type II secretion system protein n=1 Tax=Prosthecobacter sp. SYSU 5D2 TaxID=3134134 RepID=UPI0031FF3BB1
MKSALPAPGARRRNGFTLLEVSTAMGLMITLSGALILMLQQHLSFMAMAQRQSFLIQEAPKIGSILGRIFQQADHYFIYENLEAAGLGAAPRLVDGGAVRLFFKTAAQTTEERIIAAEEEAAGTSLRFYTRQADGSSTSWLICQGLQAASFRADGGILEATLTGPNGEEISYCGGAR